MISPKQLKLGASILIGAIMGFAVVSYLIVSSQYEQVSLNDKGQEEEVTESNSCQEEEVIERYKYVGKENGIKDNINRHNTVSKCSFLQVSFGSVLMVLAIIGLLVGIVLSIFYNKRAAISLAIAMGVLLIVYLGSTFAVKQWKTTPYQVYQEHAENLMAGQSGADAADAASQKSTDTDSDSEDENNLADQEIDESTEDAASPETADCEQDSEEPYTEGLINRAAAGVYTLTAFIILGILAVLFSIFYPVVLTMLSSKK